jgi:transposase
LRYEFRRWLDTIDIKNLVFIDETGVNLAMTRNYGRCQGGARVYYNRPGNKGKNITLIGAMSEEGLIATMTFPGSLNTASFLVFVEEILLPQLWIGAIVVMDNLPVHYAETTKALIESVGYFVKFLPTYSPDLSPIELCWSKLKEILRSAKTRTADALDEAITMAVNLITDENALNWFNHCGLFFEPIRELLLVAGLLAKCCMSTDRLPSCIHEAAASRLQIVYSVAGRIFSDGSDGQKLESRHLHSAS